MRDDPPPFARFVFGVASFVMAATGVIVWVIGWALFLGAGLGAASINHLRNERELWSMGIMLFGGLVLQPIGSAMYFFSQTLIEYKPQNVPTELLPRWWLARFMVTLCVQLAIISLIGVLSCMFRLDPVGLPWALGSSVGIQGFRYFRMKTIKLSPPYPPRSGPPKWKTRG